LPGASRRLLKVAEAAAKVALALLIVPMLLCLASLSQTARLTLFLFWFLSLFFDYYTTWRFYMADPDGFEDKEKSPIFKRLKARFGFKKGLLALVFLGEVPAGLLLSFIGVPAVGGAFGITASAAEAYLAAGFAVLGLIHLYSGARNLSIEFSEASRGAQRRPM